MTGLPACPDFPIGRTPAHTKTKVAGLEVVVVARLEGWSEQWDALVDVMELPSPFLRSWWLEGTAGPTPMFVLVTEDGDLAGGLALQADRRFGIRRLRNMGHGLLKADHLDLVHARGREGDVIDALRSWFEGFGPCLVELSGLAQGARVRGVLPPSAKERIVAVAPWGRLAPSFEEYLATRPTILRNSIRRAARRLEKVGAAYRVVPADQTSDAVAELGRLNVVRFGIESGLAPVFQAFARAAVGGAGRGEAVFYQLTVDDEVIATEMWFEVAGVASFFQSGRDPDPRWNGSGTLLKARVVEDLCARGLGVMDLLRDDEPYKHLWVSETRAVVELRVARGLRARIVMAALLPAARRVEPLWWFLRRTTRRARGES